jgi:mannose-1-phosphate guanylyltransferase
MFIWRADAILDAMERHLPEVAESFGEIGGPEDTSAEAVRQAYERTPKISIDYGVMERATAAGDPVLVVPGSFGWSDVGDWRAVYSLAEKDTAGNATEGEVVLHNAARCYARADGRLLALVGVQDVAVIDTGDAVLVCDIEQAQQVKNVVDFLGSRGMTDYV